MNKKIKVIELWSINAQIEDSKKIPQKIKYNGDIYELQMSRDYYSCEKHEYLTNMANNKRLDIFLNDYVEILEDNTEEIEELDYEIDVNEDEYTITKLQCYIQLNKEKINKLVREARQQRKINDEIMMCLKRTSDFLGDKGYSEVRNYIERAENAVNKLRKEKE